LEEYDRSRGLLESEEAKPIKKPAVQSQNSDEIEDEVGEVSNDGSIDEDIIAESY
jgi:hypothetical protein